MPNISELVRKEEERDVALPTQFRKAMKEAYPMSKKAMDQKLGKSHD